MTQVFVFMAGASMWLGVINIMEWMKHKSLLCLLLSFLFFLQASMDFILAIQRIVKK